MKIEKRDVPFAVTLREDSAGTDGGKLAGYAAKFGVESCPLFEMYGGGPFVEIIKAGAFARSLRENPDIRALYNHDTSIVLGRTKAGTLRLREDSTGLAFEVDLPNTRAAQDVRESVRRGDIDGCSFGFVVVEDDIQTRTDGITVRTLLDVDLIEISPAVAFPAYDSTSVDVRSRKADRSRPRLDALRRKLRLVDLGLAAPRKGGRK